MRRFQLDRVAAALVQDTKRDAGQVRDDIERLLRQEPFAPEAGSSVFRWPAGRARAWSLPDSERERGGRPPMIGAGSNGA
jgi:hypothetical protein